MCAGIADCFTFLSGLVFTMTTLFGYLTAVLELKHKPEHLYSSREEEAFWRSVRLEPSPHRVGPVAQVLERRLRAAEARVTTSEFKLRAPVQGSRRLTPPTPRTEKGGRARSQPKRPPDRPVVLLW